MRAHDLDDPAFVFLIRGQSLLLLFKFASNPFSNGRNREMYSFGWIKSQVPAGPWLTFMHVRVHGLSCCGSACCFWYRYNGASGSRSGSTLKEKSLHHLQLARATIRESTGCIPFQPLESENAEQPRNVMSKTMKAATKPVRRVRKRLGM
jgi:hypothetical protein